MANFINIVAMSQWSHGEHLLTCVCINLSLSQIDVAFNVTNPMSEKTFRRSKCKNLIVTHHKSDPIIVWIVLWLSEQAFVLCLWMSLCVCICVYPSCHMCPVLIYSARGQYT